MVIPFTAGERALFRLDNEGAMQDRGAWLRRTSQPDPGTGEDVVSYPEEAVYPCGFDPTGGKEQTVQTPSLPGVDLIVADATVRLPVSAQGIKPWDRFELLERFGEPLSVTVTYDIIAPPEVGPSGVVLQLRWIQI